MYNINKLFLKFFVIFQAIHNREIDEKDRKMKFRLEQQKTDLNSQVS